MTPLARIIAQRIAALGPMSLADYMQLCLLHPQHGYYATRDPFGRGGDFITAPEISQIFGEICALALAQAWHDQGAPDAVLLAEPGPGRGMLMSDMIRTLAKVAPAMTRAAQIALIEASPHLRGIQRDLLGPVTHLDHLDQLPDGPVFLIANEFFDALPIRQFQRSEDGWRERVVGYENGHLCLGLSAPLDLARDEAVGTVIEDCAAAPPMMTAIARRIAAHGGAAIIFDYGGWNGTGDTFQALRAHAPEDPLARPGQADLTAHVDFAPLALAALSAGAMASRPVHQGDWLLAMGAGARAARLTAAGDQGAEGSLRRLTHPGEMGHLFKAMAIWPKGALPVSGFDALRPHADDA